MKTLLLALLLALPGQAAWVNLGAGGSCANNSKTTGTSLSCTVATGTLGGGSANTVILVVFAMDNVTTTDTQSSDCTSAQDSKGNGYTKIGEFTNGNGSAAAGATVCAFFSVVGSNAPGLGDTVTVNHSSTGSRGIRAFGGGVDTGNSVQLAGTLQTEAVDGGDPGSLTVGSLANVEHLFLRVTALERATGGTWTLTTSYSQAAGCSGTTGGGAASNMDVCHEYRVLTGTTDTSNPTGTNVDNASIFAALDEFTPAATTGIGYFGNNVGVF